MATLRRSVLLVLALCVLGGVVHTRLRRPSRPDVAVREEAVVPPALPAATPAASGARPTRADVRPLLERLAGGALLPDERSDPWLAVGDFDGDGAIDVAAAVRLRAAGDSLADSSLRLLDAAAPGPPPAPAGLASGERLLAIVHGVVGRPWSDPTADRPAFLLRHASGAAVRAQPLADLPAEVRMRVTRAHVGDVVAPGPGAIVFWNGAAYVRAVLPVAVRDGGRPVPP
jgi:hypothetical protein